MAKVPNILFVHGAWANASSWARVLPLIEEAGLSGTAVSLPLTTLEDDVATVQRAMELIDGPVLLVGHSYGGSVITEAGRDPKVPGWSMSRRLRRIRGSRPRRWARVGRRRGYWRRFGPMRMGFSN